MGKKTQIQSIELYGFFIWTLTALLYIVFLIWSYVPVSVLNNWGIHYIPNNYFALAIPTWLSVSAWILIEMYCAIGMILTHPKDSYKSMQDYASVLAHPKSSEPTNAASDNIFQSHHHQNHASSQSTNNLIYLKNASSHPLKKGTSMFIPT